MINEATLTGKCPDCCHPVVVCVRWVPGSVKGYGGFVVECDECGRNYDLRIGRDTNLSEVVYGAQFLGQYDDYIYGQRKAIREKFGVDPELKHNQNGFCIKVWRAETKI